MADIYVGDGLRDVPRGTVRTLRLFTYQFAYHGMGGQVNRVGLDGPWDVKRIIGTVPVEPDGSAYFRVPANVPISMQPLDAEGKALQLMRSWMTAMPGEVLSCVGCHERQNSSVPNRQTMALARPPVEIAPWYGPTRGFSFKREVQPVLDASCVGCHDGQPRQDGKALPDFTAREEVHPQARDKGYNGGTKFSPSYIALRSYVRAHTIESDINLLYPYEFHADTTELVQRLKKGHNGVQLGPEAWDRLLTWIDLNTPYHGTWHEIIGMNRVAAQRDRRRAMDALYAGLDEDPEAITEISYKPQAPSPKPESHEPRATSREPVPEHRTPNTDNLLLPGWPFDKAEAQRRQAALGPVEQTVDLGGGVKLDLVRIPAGEFLMGDAAGDADEQPLTRVPIKAPFWMGKFEVTNEQFALFDPRHDSRIEHGDFLQFSTQERGYPVNGSRQPVCRVNWSQAMAFCRWLSAKTGQTFSLPTEAQWEWACRAGTATPLYYGALETDFAKLANLADHTLRFVDTFGWGLPSGAVPPWRPAIESVNDRFKVSAPVGAFEPNAWGLHDMAGNVWEWTRSAYRPYPSDRSDTSDRSDGAIADRQLPIADLKAQSEIGNRKSEIAQRLVVRGGSWYTRPQRARSAFRLAYPAWARIYDVGFRVLCQEAPKQVR
jgi:formylglycine-generating enzyme required for sulfatase activity